MSMIGYRTNSILTVVDKRFTPFSDILRNKEHNPNPVRVFFYLATPLVSKTARKVDGLARRKLYKPRPLSQPPSVGTPQLEEVDEVGRMPGNSTDPQQATYNPNGGT